MWQFFTGQGPFAILFHSSQELPFMIPAIFKGAGKEIRIFSLLPFKNRIPRNLSLPVGFYQGPIARVFHRDIQNDL